MCVPCLAVNVGIMRCRCCSATCENLELFISFRPLFRAPRLSHMRAPLLHLHNSSLSFAQFRGYRYVLHTHERERKKKQAHQRARRELRAKSAFTREKVKEGAFCVTVTTVIYCAFFSRRRRRRNFGVCLCCVNILCACLSLAGY